MKFKKGDRVFVISYGEVGTVDSCYEQRDENNEDHISVCVIPDDQRSSFPITKHDAPLRENEEVSVSIHTTEDDLELLNVPNEQNPEWVDLWEPDDG